MRGRRFRRHGGVLFAVTSGGFAVFGEVASGPEETAGDEIEVMWIHDGGGVVADGGGEDFGFVRAVFIGPGDDGVGLGRFGIRGELLAFFGFGRDDLITRGEGLAGEDLDVVVELFVDGGPVFEATGDGAVFIGEGDADGLLGAVASGLETEVFVPAGIVGTGLHRLAEIAPAVAVHGAVEIDGGFACFVGSEDGSDVGGIGDVSAAFVMDDDVEVFVPVFGFVDFKGGFGALVGVVGDIDDGIEPCFDAFFEGDRLLGVVMAAAASDDEDAQWLDGCIGRGGEVNTCGEGEEGKEEFHEDGRDFLEGMSAG